MPGVISISQDTEKPGKNLIASKRGIHAVNATIDKRNLKAAIKRINRVREKEKTIQEEGQRIGEAIQERGNTVAVLGAEKARQPQGVEETTTQEDSLKNCLEATIIDTKNPNSIEAGKGEKVNNSI